MLIARGQQFPPATTMVAAPDHLSLLSSSPTWVLLGAPGEVHGFAWEDLQQVEEEDITLPSISTEVLGLVPVPFSWLGSLVHPDQLKLVLQQVVEWARWWGRKKSRVEGRRWASYGAMEYSRPLLFAQGTGDWQDV